MTLRIIILRGNHRTAKELLESSLSEFQHYRLLGWVMRTSQTSSTLNTVFRNTTALDNRLKPDIGPWTNTSSISWEFIDSRSGLGEPLKRPGARISIDKSLFPRLPSNILS